MPEQPEFNLTSWKSVCASLGIETQTIINTFGQTDIRLDRAGMERLRNAAAATGQTEMATFFEKCLNARGWK